MFCYKNKKKHLTMKLHLGTAQKVGDKFLNVISCIVNKVLT